MSNQEETSGQMQDTLERLYLSWLGNASVSLRKVAGERKAWASLCLTRTSISARFFFLVISLKEIVEIGFVFIMISL